MDHDHRRRCSDSRRVGTAWSGIEANPASRGWPCRVGSTKGICRRGIFRNMESARKYKVGLVQMRMGPDPEANFASAIAARPRGGASRSEHRLPAGAFSRAVFLPARRHQAFRSGRGDSRPVDRAARRACAREREWSIVASLFERRAAGLYHNTAVTLRAGRHIISVYRKMHIPDDPLYYEKFYFTPGDLGFQAVDTRIWPRRHAGLLGSVVSGRRAADGAAGSRSPVLSHRHRLASGRERGVRRGAV